MRAVIALSALVTSVGLGACAAASEETSGGQARVDASPVAEVPRPVPDAGDGGRACGVDGRASGATASFAELYAKLLGPSGAASCAGNAQCHGGAGQPGGGVFVCAADKAECRNTLVTNGIVTPGEKDFSKTLLGKLIRKMDGTGRMPKAPFTYTFCPEDVARLGEWVANGAKDD